MRAFVAVDISGGAAESIARFQSAAGIDARPVDRDNLHFTLQFLGQIGSDTVQKIAEALGGVKFSGFLMRLVGVGAFPSSKSPRTIWVGVDAGSAAALRELAGAVSRALKPLGFGRDRPFLPHATIFRARRNSGDMTGTLRQFLSAEFASQDVKSMKLKQSVLTPDGPVYSDLYEVGAVR